jgi:hypothetical protein
LYSGCAAQPQWRNWIKKFFKAKFLRPGGEQAQLRDGWFMKEGCKVFQPMIFLPDEPTSCSKAKEMQQVLVEQGLWQLGLKMQCRKKKDGTGNKCLPESTDCWAKCVLDLQPDFKEQRSLV